MKLEHPKPRVVILWMRFGPYHLARLRAADAALSAHGYELHPLQVAKTDHYEWEVLPQDDEIRATALFESRPYGDIPRAEIRRATRRALDRISPEAVAINGWSVPEARAALKWCKRNGRRAILFSDTGEFDAPRIWWKERAKAHLVGMFDSAVVAGKPHVEYAAKLGMDPGRIFKGYDVVDNSHFEHGAAHARRLDAETRATLGLPQRYVLANTRFLPRKNIAALLRAFHRYREKEKDAWDLVLSGTGSTEEGDRQLARELEILEHVHWVGFTQYEQLPSLYGLASAFVHAPITEAWGLVVNEACAASLPILLSRTAGSASELLHEGVNGFGFDPHDNLQITNALVSAHELLPAARLAMGEASHRIIADWSPRRFASSVVKALQIGNRPSYNGPAS